MSKDGIKRRWGDKKDGRLIRKKELDTNHYIMPYLWPNRTDNEAFITDVIDLTNADAYLKRINEQREKKISLFTLIIAIWGKAVLNRPKMNRFYRNKKLYERYNVTAGFTIKKEFKDDGDEALARINIDPEDNLFSLADKVQHEIEKCKGDEIDKSSDDVRIMMKFPRFITSIIMGFMKFLNKRTSIPESVSASDMFFCSIAFSVLGSIKLQAGYHHLSNWGTNSFFTTIGEKKYRPFYDRFGNMTLKNSIDIGLTIDERIVDGYYYARSLSLIKSYFENPEILENPFKDDKEDEDEK